MSGGLALVLIGSLLGAPIRGWWGATLNASRPTLFVIDRRGAILTVLAGEMLVESRIWLLLDPCIPTL